MRTTPILVTLGAAAALALGACKTQSPTGLLGGNGPDPGGEGEAPGAGATAPSNVQFTPNAANALSLREADYGEALRTASLKLNMALPTLAQVQKLQTAADPQQAYEDALDAMFADTRFQERMIKWWQDTMRLAGAAKDGKPSRDTAPTFAARVVAEEQPFTNLFTAASNTCPTYDYSAHTFADGDCKNGAPATAGVLTDPGVMYQFYGDLAFRRVRWIQEVFVCTAFPAEFSAQPVAKGSADYTSPWPFTSVATMPINFQDTSSVICANCHTTINHIAPLFGNFDDAGMYQSKISVMTPVAPTPVPTEFSHWLQPGETTHWRNGVPVADLAALGQAVAADPDVAECIVARLWNFAMSKGDIVTDLATVPPSVLAAPLDTFQKSGQNVKKTLRAIFASDDFVKY